MKLKIKMDVLRASVVIFLGTTDEAKKHLPKWWGDDDEYLARAGIDSNKSKGLNVFIHTKTAALSVIAHEAVHAATMILYAMGCQHDLNDDEVQAYIVQYIVEAVEKEYFE